METRFVIPAAVALSLHALALVNGHQHDRGGTVPPKETAPTLIPFPLMEIFQEPVPPGNEPAGASSAAGNPELPEPPPDASREGLHIDLPRTPTVPGPINPTSTISAKGWGIGEGAVGIPGDRLISMAALDNPPRTRARVAPVYPFEAKNSGRAGEVLVEFVVDESGRVVNPRVVRSSDVVFEAPTLKAVAKWRFEPGRVQGQPVRFRMALPVQFSVNDP